MSATSVCVLRVSSSCLLPLWVVLQDQQVGLTQAPFILLLLPWVPEHVRFCVHSLRVESQFPTALWLSQNNSLWSSKPNVLGAHLPDTGPSAGEPDIGLRSLTPWGESLKL